MTETYLLVLGSRVSDGRAEPVLETRLRRAADLIAELLADGHDTTMVVSGRGEAGVMYDWLVDAGVDPARLLQEPEATSTNENLENAHALVPGVDKWLVVTSDFHAWRTRLWAWHLGIPITVYTARTPASEAFNWVRELVATPHSALRVAWRRIRRGR